MAQRGESQREVLDGVRGGTNRESLVGAGCERASKRRQRVSSLYHRRQDVASMQQAGRTGDAERVLRQSRGGVGRRWTRRGHGCWWSIAVAGS